MCFLSVKVLNVWILCFHEMLPNLHPSGRTTLLLLKLSHDLVYLQETLLRQSEPEPLTHIVVVDHLLELLGVAVVILHLVWD